MSAMRFLFSALVTLFVACPLAAAELVGKATIIDGDTVEIDGKIIGIHGIDAPEMDQFCRDAMGKPFKCGHAAMRRLFLYIGADPLRCRLEGPATGERLAATCRVKSYFRNTENGATRGEMFDVGLEMVLTGHAFARRSESDIYVAAEKRARDRNLGFWKGEVTPPWIWRRGSGKTNK